MGIQTTDKKLDVKKERKKTQICKLFSLVRQVELGAAPGGRAKELNRICQTSLSAVFDKYSSLSSVHSITESKALVSFLR